MMAGVRVRPVADQLRVLLRHGAWQSRSSVCACSTAPQQRNTGDQTTSGNGNGGGGGSSGSGGGDTTKDKRTFSVRALEKKAKKLEEDVQDLKGRYEKALLDSETVRKRTQKFVEDAKLFGIQSFCRDLVEVVDILEDAIEKATNEGSNDTSEILTKIESKLQTVFTKHGLRKMTPVGGDYDPYDHEVVCHVPAEGRRPGSIATVSQDGYKLHGRTIRHAHVGIAVEKQQ
ncbi:grpE protein homolog 2, mitochondrial [Pyxicephalus adspersus]|uniref:GrpE protein homolog n=1 Tax=Pyxicephalus adspersus TaxID=30357 RepID=A0AAV3AHK0_PYXAD|nr:TPA: hypothetical protein GDO54_006799 [Pyxicephalus adspersus]